MALAHRADVPPEVLVPDRADDETDVTRGVKHRVALGAVPVRLVFDEMAEELVFRASPLERELLDASVGFIVVLAWERER